jgi:hypothetical protein
LMGSKIFNRVPTHQYRPALRTVLVLIGRFILSLGAKNNNSDR